MKSVLTLALTMICFASFAQSGSNDQSFNPGTAANNVVNALALQSDGKILVGGNFTSFNALPRKRLVRLNTSGTLDASFDINLGFNQAVFAIAIQQDGKIIVGGNFTTFNGTSRSRILRLNMNGSIDLSFDPGLGFNNAVRTIAIQPDGKILVGGLFTSFNGAVNNRIVRLNADGSQDFSFSAGSGFNNSLFTIKLLQDGKILAGGSFVNFNGISRNRIARLNSDGTLDTGFNPGSGFNNVVFSIDTQQDGKILAGGNFTSFSGTQRIRITRLNTNGSHDASFNPGTGFNKAVRSIAVQQDDKVVVGGLFTIFNGAEANRIIRLNGNGSADPIFVSGSGFNNSTFALALQNDGKILVGGSFVNYNGVSRNRIIRLDACLIPSAPAGLLTQSFCNAATVGDLSANGSNIQWFGSAIGGSALDLSEAVVAPGTYYASQSVNGCESLNRLPVAVVINNSSTNIIAESACSSFTINGQTYNASGVYTQNLTNLVGCDSILTVDLTVLATSTFTFSESVCDTYLWNNQEYTSSGTYIQYFENASGCDSIVTLELSVFPTSTNLSVSACEAYTVNDQTYFESGTYTQLLTNLPGCHVALFIDLTINNSSNGYFNATACNNYSLNGVNYAQSGLYTQILTNSVGCDSILTLNLVINQSEAVSISVNGNVLSSSNTNGSYQWLDCGNGNTPIAGANAQSFTPSTSGLYSVEVTENGCTQISSCVSININSAYLDEISDLTKSIVLFPNPAESSIQIQLSQVGNIEIINATGQLLYQSGGSDFYTLDLTNYQAGIYFVRFMNQIQRFVKF